MLVPSCRPIRLSAESASVRPHILGHSHNDEEQKRPLEDALAAGFTSVEVDLQLVQGKLLVGHTPVEALQHGRTLEQTYLGPLQERVSRFGAVYPGADEKPFQLVLDIKGPSQATYEELLPLLRRYQSMLTVVTEQQLHPGPLQVVLTGNQPDLRSSRERLVFSDGAVSKVLAGSQLDPLLSPTVSGNYRGYFRWSGEGSMPPAQASRLRDLAERVHSQGATLRLWGAPDCPNAWSALAQQGVDRISTDQPGRFAQWLEGQPEAIFSATLCPSSAAEIIPPA